MKRGGVGGAVAELDLPVPSMMCDGCAETIHAALIALPGVRGVKVSLWRKRVRVCFEPSRLEKGRIRQTIAAGGFADP